MQIIKSIKGIFGRKSQSPTATSSLPDTVYEYDRTGESTATNRLGMRPMQERVWDKRHSRFLLVKSPPASGKSRALIYLAKFKLAEQSIKKVVIAVPERIIGRSFAATKLGEFAKQRSDFHGKEYGDWQPDADLCAVGDTINGKVGQFKRFMADESQQVLICAHATLRNAVTELGYDMFHNVLLAVDEFHHVSAHHEENRLGEIVHKVMTASNNSHIVAMTGSYFRGDNDAILLPEDEQKFVKVNYDYYEMLNGYKYLKSLGIGYHFYEGRWTDAIGEVLDIAKKTLIHIPHTRSAEHTGDKIEEAGKIIDAIAGDSKVEFDEETGIRIIYKNNRVLKVANLVDNEDEAERDRTVKYLQNMQSGDIDIIIAMKMAKEGFDWPECEHTITVGYRDSMTEIVQIIGRCTRDYPGKEHAQFTNLIVKPSIVRDKVTKSVNDMLKAITCSLLMEQVLTPNFNFKPKGDRVKLNVKGTAKPSKEVQDIMDNQLDSLKLEIFRDPATQRSMTGEIAPEIVHKGIIPRIIKKRFPNLQPADREALRQSVVVDMVLKSKAGDKFVNMTKGFVKIHSLDIDLIDSINPFQAAYEIISKSFDSNVFKAIQSEIRRTRLTMTESEALSLFGEIRKFKLKHDRLPDINAVLPTERALGEALAVLQKAKRKAGL